MMKRSEITYMQARIARLAAEKWGLSIREVGRILEECKVLEYIRDCWELFHLEGDEAVWEDLQPYLKRKGCPYAAV